MVGVFPLTPQLRDLYVSPLSQVFSPPGDRMKALDVDMAHRDINRAQSADFFPSACLPLTSPIVPRRRPHSDRPQVQPKAPPPAGAQRFPCRNGGWTLVHTASSRTRMSGRV